MKRSPLKRGKPLKSTGGLRRSALKQTVPTEPDELTQSRGVVHDRSGGFCELRLPGCTRSATDIHHRKLRRHGDHSPVCLLHLCSLCHNFVHAHVALSYEMGWLLRSHDSPSAVPVTLLDSSLIAVKGLEPR